MAEYEIELPAAYLDNLIEDAVPGVLGATPTLINTNPEPDEDTIARDGNIELEIATLDPTGTVDLATVSVYIGGVLAFAAGTFSAGFDGPDSADTNPQADVLRIVIDPTTDFESESVVSVRVVARAVGDTSELDTTYSFTIEDYVGPLLIAVEAQDLQRVRCTFDEPIDETTATDPANWTLDRLGDYLDPVASVVVESVELVSSNSVDLITDIPLTPGGNYRATPEGVEDTEGNATASPSVDFLGWQPPVPAGRDFNLYRKLPSINRQEDETLDLYRFAACLQEVAGLLLYEIDRFIDIIDPDTAPEEFVDAMLADLGNPFNFDLALVDKRRLAQILVDIYRLKGTEIGIISVVRFFLGLEVTVDAFNLSATAWVLGESELGIDSDLGTSSSYSLYSFTVTVAEFLTDAQREQLSSIVEYMKPAHTHFVELIEPEIPDIPDHMELGLSELGETWLLH